MNNATIINFNKSSSLSFLKLYNIFTSKLSLKLIDITLLKTLSKNILSLLLIIRDN